MFLISPPGRAWKLSDFVHAAGSFYSLVPSSSSDWTTAGGTFGYTCGITVHTEAGGSARMEQVFPAYSSVSWAVSHRVLWRILPGAGIDWGTSIPTDCFAYLKIGDRDNYIGVRLTPNIAGTNITVYPVCSTGTGVWGYATAFTGGTSISEHTIELEVLPGTGGTVSCALWVDGIQIGGVFSVQAPSNPDSFITQTTDNSMGASACEYRIAQLRGAVGY